MLSHCRERCYQPSLTRARPDVAAPGLKWIAKASRASDRLIGGAVTRVVGRALWDGWP
jgi:hypothetical protein